MVLLCAIKHMKTHSACFVVWKSQLTKNRRHSDRNPIPLLSPALVIGNIFLHRRGVAPNAPSPKPYSGIIEYESKYKELNRERYFVAKRPHPARPRAAPHTKGTRIRISKDDTALHQQDMKYLQ